MISAKKMFCYIFRQTKKIDWSYVQQALMNYPLIKLSDDACMSLAK